MSEITPSPNMNEINLFKNEIYGHVRELDSKLMSKINKNHALLKEDIESYERKILSLIENNKEVVLSLVSQKLQLEKISEFESFKNKVGDMVITHEVRIKNNLEEISRIKLKYDKLLSENLYVPGFIGSACQFKNLSEYLSYNISEVSKLKIEKDQLKKDIKDLKSKFEGLMKNMITLNDTSVKLCKQYTDNKQTEYLNIIENKTNEMNQKSLENKALICHFQDNAEKNEKKNHEQFEKLMNMKKEFIDIIDEKLVDVHKFNEELNKKSIDNKLDIEIDRKKIDNLNDQIKELNKNTKDISFQMRNYYGINNKISNLIDKLEKMGTKPKNSEIVKFKNEINLSNNNLKSINYSLSPGKKIGNRQNLTRSAFNFKPEIDEIKPYNNKMAKSIIKNKKAIKEIEKKIKDDISDSESTITVNINDDNNNINKDNKKIETNNNNNELMFNKKINTPTIVENIKSKINKTENNNVMPLNIPENNNTLPSLPRNFKEKNSLEENKKLNLSSNEINKSGFIKEEDKINKNEQKTKIKKSNILHIINNEYEKNKIKDVKKKGISFNRDYDQLEQDKQACKLVTLTLPAPLKETFITKKNKVQKNKLKNDVMNSLINSYRAKLFYKAHSPDEKIELTNEILDIPKKVTQAFGRTAYTFYFNKEQLSNLNINLNKNIHSFGHSKSKNNHKEIKNVNQDDTGQ